MHRMTTGDSDGLGLTVAARIRAAREAAGMSQRQAAATLGVSQPGYARWERPDNTFDRTRRQLEQIAAAFGTTAEKLFGDGA